MRYALTIAYDGTDYCGWQVQPNGATVQAEVEGAVYRAFGVRARVCASGRTDSGVHALGQVAHVDLPVDIRGDRLADALNVCLPQDISVLSSRAVEGTFDANRSAKRKTYRYNMYISPRRNPLKERYSVRLENDVDIPLMQKAGALFVGVHDFKAYCASGSQVKTTEREIYSLAVTRSGEDLTVEVCGNGFLYNMVRTLVGTLLRCASGKLTEEDIKNSLLSGDRTLVGKTMPAKGLVLYGVEYV